MSSVTASSSSPATRQALETAEFLSRLDDQAEGLARLEGKHPLLSGGGTVAVVSDLHLAEGRLKGGTYRGTENFFADEAFGRFLQSLRTRVPPGSPAALLVINGDFVDFLRITRVPAHDQPTTADLVDWQNLLSRIGLPWSLEDLQRSITRKEDRFGLKTHPHKSAWKLAVAVQGHRPVFAALAEWLAAGHRLAIVSGNHDLEWYWKPVRDCLRLVLAGLASGDAVTNLRRFSGQLVFSHEGFTIDNRLAIEHGHRFDRFSRVIGGPTFGGPQELNIPFGSFFNRYLLNRIEQSYPFLDNVRPHPAILPFLMRQRFPLALRLLFQHVPFMLRIIPKKYYAYVLRRTLWFFAAVLGPLIAVVFLLGRELSTFIGPTSSSGSEPLTGWLGGLGVKVVRDASWLVGSYVLSQVVAWLQLREPADLDEPARRLLRQNPEWRILTMGHTHNPSHLRQGEQVYFNTCTWIDIVEITSGELRLDCANLFLQVSPGSDGHAGEGSLWRWNDDAGRAEPAVVVTRRLDDA